MAADATAPRRSGSTFALPRIPLWIVYAAGLLPAAWYFILGVADELGADPLNVLERALGLWALRFLVAGLAITPMRQSFGVNLLRYRRAVGLLAFYYAALHLAVYALLDQGLDVGAIWADIVKRPFITVGLLSFGLLVPLAITSNNAMVRRLGGEAWSRLHRLIYLIAPAAAVHFILLVKAWPPEPLVYAALIVLLLGYRLVRTVSNVRIRKRAPSYDG